MKMPKMILFDYGQTLIAEQKFDGVKGREAVLQHTEDRNILTITDWNGLRLRLDE